MIDINLIRENKELVKTNIKKKFQEKKLPLVDEIYDLDKEYREIKTKADNLRSEKNKVSASIGELIRNKKIKEADEVKETVSVMNTQINELEKKEEELSEQIRTKMMMIPQIIDASVPIGINDTENVEIEKFGEPFVPSYEIPYHADIMEKLAGLDKDAAARTSGNGTGLGLSIVKSLVEMHGGEIILVDKPKNGMKTEFLIKIKI